MRTLVFISEDEEELGLIRVEAVHTRVDSQRVHPVPEGPLLPSLSWKGGANPSE